MLRRLLTSERSGVVKTFRWASQTIGTSSEFAFSIPAKYATPEDFARFLITELGLNLGPPTAERSFWAGCHLGFHLHFTPDHEKHNDPAFVDDGQGIDYANHKSSIGLTGSGSLRVALVPMMLNIAMSICYFHESAGYLLGDGGALLAHFEWNPSKSLFWNLRDGVPFSPQEVQSVYRF